MDISDYYGLPEKNYIKVETIKKSIILGNLYNSPEINFTKWTTRYNGDYKKTAAFTIDVAGCIYRHFDPTYYSNIIGNVELDKRNIVILLENEGWLVKNEKENKFIDWMGYIYNRSDEIFEKKWRNQQFWAPYSIEQVDSTINLVTKLCGDFNIKKLVIPHNTKIDDTENFEGIFYRSNIEKHYTDLSPAWSCENFKYRLENEK